MGMPGTDVRASTTRVDTDDAIGLFWLSCPVSSKTFPEPAMGVHGRGLTREWPLTEALQPH